MNVRSNLTSCLSWLKWVDATFLVCCFRLYLYFNIALTTKRTLLSHVFLWICPSVVQRHIQQCVLSICILSLNTQILSKSLHLFVKNIIDFVSPIENKLITIISTDNNNIIISMTKYFSNSIKWLLTE